MTQRIDELFGQALDQAVPETWTTLDPVQLSRLKNKFAELIVKECAEVGLDSVEDGDDLDAIMKRVHNNILTHFGVEE